MNRLEQRDVKESLEIAGEGGDMLTEDAYSLSIGRGIRYNTCEMYHYRAAMEYDEYGNLTDEYIRIRELEGMPPEKTENQVKDALKKLGLQADSCSVTYFALPHALMAQKELWTDPEGNEISEYNKASWTEEDDAYYFLLHQSWQGLPVYHEYVFPDNCDMNAPLRVLWSRRGLEALETDYYFLFEADEEPLYLIEFEKVADTVAQKYNEVITEAQYTVTDAALYQRPDYWRWSLTVWCSHCLALYFLASV